MIRSTAICLSCAIAMLPGPLSAFVDDTPDSPAESAPAPEGVEPVIPLNKEDPTYDIWKQRRDDLNAGRETGPIDVQRYPGGFSFQGIPKFFRSPVALTPDDLTAGNVDVAIISAHTDMGIGVRGASRGPNDLRANGDVYGPWGAFAPDTGTPEPGGLNPREVFPLIRQLCAQKNVVGFDLVEYAPDRDPGYVTGLVANRILRECLTGIALNKEGLAAEYLHPLVVDDGRE